MAVIEISGSGLHPVHDTPKLWSRWYDVLSVEEVRVLLFMHDHVPDGGGVYAEDPKLIAEACDVSQTKFRGIIVRLEKLGLVSLDDD
jgi:hypothetical protein